MWKPKTKARREKQALDQGYRISSDPVESGPTALVGVTCIKCGETLKRRECQVMQKTLPKCPTCKAIDVAKRELPILEAKVEAMRTLIGH